MLSNLVESLQKLGKSMKPKSAHSSAQPDFFKTELVSLIDMQHPLVKLASQIPWEEFERQVDPTYSPTMGAPGIPSRLMAALQLLKFKFNLSDEDVVTHWMENPYWQFFSGMQFFSTERPIDPSSMTRWRNRLGASGAESLLKLVVNAGLNLKAIKPSDLANLNVDTTVQTKAIRYPTDARLNDRVRERLVKTARKEGFKVKQSFQRTGRRLVMKQSRYAHARQMKRAQACQRKLKTNLGRIIREVERQSPVPESATGQMLALAKKIHAQKRGDSEKIYSVHEPQVQCIAKGKAGKKYEFGNKVSLAVTSKNGWVVGALSFEKNPYDGHTLSQQLEQVRSIVGEGKIKNVFADRGYRGHKHQGPENVTLDQERRGSIPRSVWKWMKRRAAIEPTIGHLKSDHRLERNLLKGTVGDAINALLSAAAMNFGKLLGWIGRFWLFFRVFRGLLNSIFSRRCPALGSLG